MPYYCRYCGSENVAQDALVHANTREVLSMYDSGFCLDCERESNWLEYMGDEPDESMDGDAASALASAGCGTDEDYGS